MPNIYETERLLAEYLLFHYGNAADIFTERWGAELKGALDFPARCAKLCFDVPGIPPDARALDVGCAVGRASFELAAGCASVTGIDFSRRFIDAADALKKSGELAFNRLDEGTRATKCMAHVPAGIQRERVSFETGDAMNLRGDLGEFDIVLGANLLCRLPDPVKFLDRLPLLVRPGGRLVLTTPCTWLEEFTARERWLCGEKSSTLDGLHRHLDAHFDLTGTHDMPFVIREHARKFQWTVALGSVWKRK